MSDWVFHSQASTDLYHFLKPSAATICLRAKAWKLDQTFHSFGLVFWQILIFADDLARTWRDVWQGTLLLEGKWRWTTFCGLWKGGELRCRIDNFHRFRQCLSQFFCSGKRKLQQLCLRRSFETETICSFICRRRNLVFFGRCFCGASSLAD